MTTPRDGGPAPDDCDCLKCARCYDRSEREREAIEGEHAAALNLLAQHLRWYDGPPASDFDEDKLIAATRAALAQREKP